MVPVRGLTITLAFPAAGSDVDISIRAIKVQNVPLSVVPGSLRSLPLFDKLGHQLLTWRTLYPINAAGHYGVINQVAWRISWIDW